MPATIDNVLDQVKDLAGNLNSLGEAQGEILAKLADDGDLMKAPAALEALEKRFDEINDSIEERIAKINRTSYDARGNYKGVFDTEDDARAFAATVFAKAADQAWGDDAQKFGQRCAEILKKDYPDIHSRAMDSTTDGALITPEFSSRLVRLVEQFGVFDSEAFVMPMGSSSLTFLRRTGGMSVFVIGENAAGTQSDPTYGNVTLNPKELGTLTYVPRTLDEDALPMMGELIAIEIAQAFAEAGDDDGFNGDGSSTYHGFTGLIPRLKTINGVDDGGGLVLGAGNAWSELTQANHDKLMGAIPTYVTDPKYFCSRPYFGQVLVKLMNAAGGVSAMEIAGRKVLAFNGDPVRLVQKMPKTEGNSQVPLLYGSIRQAATIGRRRGVTVETSRDYKFAERQLTVLGTERKAINCHDLGTATEAGPLVGLITASS